MKSECLDHEQPLIFSQIFLQYLRIISGSAGLRSLLVLLIVFLASHGVSGQDVDCDYYQDVSITHRSTHRLHN